MYHPIQDNEISDESEVTKDHESEKDSDTKSNSLEQFTQSLDNNLSERVTQLVEDILAKAKADEDNKASEDVKESDGGEANRQNIILSIWDFAGQAVYYTTHQVNLHNAVHLIPMYRA